MLAAAASSPQQKSRPASSLSILLIEAHPDCHADGLICLANAKTTWANDRFMLDILSYTFYLLAGICSYAAFTHFMSGISKPRDRIHIVFSLICVLIALAAISRSFVIQATSISAYAMALKWNVAMSQGVLLLLPWFVALYTERFSLPYLYFVNILIGISFAANLYFPFGVSYAEITSLRYHHLPWGESITHGVGHHTPLFLMGVAAVAVILIRTLYDLCKAYATRRSRTDLWMLIAFTLFSAFVTAGILVRLSVLDSSSPEVFVFLAVIVVMSTTLTRKKQEYLRASESRFRSLIEQAPLGVALIKKGVLIDANPLFLRMHGYQDVDQIRGLSLIEDFQLRIHDAASRLPVDDEFNEIADSSFETTSRRINGTQMPVYVSARRIELNGEAIQIAFISDQTSYNESQERARNLAHYDTLTGLPNKPFLFDRIQSAMLSSQMSKRWGALLLIDLNEFRLLNDSLGHEIGDLLLKCVAKRLSNRTRSGDTVARIGGDEFVVLINNLSTDHDGATALAESRSNELINVLHRPYRLAAHEYHSAASIGISLFNGVASQMEEIFKHAEVAMYQAKTHRSSNVCFYDPQMQDVITNRLDLESELRKAIESKNLCFYFQPQVDGQRRVIGAEALVRWKHPDRGFIAPADFIPIAEESGLILPLGRSLLEQACLQLKRWQGNQSTKHIVLAINISAKQFRQPDFADSVQATLQKHGTNPRLLKLELTESMLLDQVADTVQTMSTLKALGVQFALDDFGTGYSSIQYLKHLPLDELKIDQSFVRDIATSKSDETIVQTVIAMAHALNLSVIAEGVETTEQMHRLMALGCEAFQGFLFGRPRSVREFYVSIERGYEANETPPESGGHPHSGPTGEIPT